MQITVQKLDNSQLELNIEVSAEEFKGFLEKAVLHLGEELEIEGFRKGKAPKEMVEKKIGQDRVLQHASQDCVRESYLKAVKEEKLEPLGQPEIEIIKMAKGDSFEFKAKIAILPEIKLPDYKKIACQIKKNKIKVTEEEIEKLRQEKERVEKERARTEILDKIAEKSQLEIPRVLIESEKQRMLESVKQQVPQVLGMSFTDYLQKMQKTEEEMLGSFQEEAQKRIKNSLVLREIERQESIAVSEKELQLEIEKITKANPGVDQSRLKEYTESVIKNEKTLQLLENFIQR